ncbi:CMP-N-acetlyneuraminic acid synthetase [Glaciecola punicea]|uniref:acylneuraminate cytidylyltransferase family protein n=1 Tax=Glaciecola punicea TaxID=56804 RepID=UPI000872D376|nr:acylneuraminate cytidylyltransferase family protein [Glaciecola punicea]OFA32764.1 CMP-N-acetlyneuraminic acid synthetase [Glaciecola punicea]
MSSGKKILAIIPARGGSKRLLNKNILLLNNKPLIAWTIEAATSSEYITDVVVSTDCQDIANSARQYGATVPFMRPAELSTDTSTSNSVLLHALEYLGAHNYDIVVSLQPTSPLRTSQDIDSAIELLNSRNAQGVVSVCPCEHSPLWCNLLPDNLSMGDFLPKKHLTSRSQDLPAYFRLNGAIYAFRTDEILKNSGITYTEHTLAYVMPSERSIDIDTKLDFKISEFILKDNEKI